LQRLSSAQLIAFNRVSHTCASSTIYKGKYQTERSKSVALF
jgi:hypothetical protein